MSEPCTSHVSILDEDVKSHGENRASRQQQGICVRSGCRRSAGDASDFCDEHHGAQLRYHREYMQRRRLEWRRAGLCTECGGNRKVDSKWCARCLIRHGKLAVKSHGENKRTERVAARIEVSRSESDGFLRKRFKGGKRGAPGIDEQDEFERRIVESAVKRYLDGAAFLSSDQGKALSQVERESARVSALGQLALAVRAAEDILERNRYTRRLAKERERRDAERQRSLARTAREFAKSGR